MTTTTLDTKTLIQELRDAHSLSTKGTWGKGSTTHETVSTTEGQKPYHIASFHHANDAQFCDLMHAYLPRILDELEAQLAAVQQGVQLPFTYAIADGYGQPFFEEEGCVSPEAKDLQPEVDSLNQNLDGEPPYKVVALYTHPTQQGLDALTDALIDCRRELQSCQSVIHLAGGFDPRYVSDAKAAIKKADAALAAQAKQGGV